MNFRNRLLKIVFAGFLAGLMLSTFLFPHMAAAMVFPSPADFGEVTIGESATVPVTIMNLGGEKVMVSVSFANGNEGFSVDRESFEIIPGGRETLNVRYAPSNVGPSTDRLILTYEVVQQIMLMAQQTQPNEIVELMGQGIGAPQETNLESILLFFDNAVQAEPPTLTGIGPGKSADNRLNALRNMIVAANNHMVSGDSEAARGQLQAVLKKIELGDSTDKSAKFVEGDSAEDLAAMIVDLLENGPLSEI